MVMNLKTMDNDLGYSIQDRQINALRLIKLTNTL